MAKFAPLIGAGWEVIPLAREGGKKPLVNGHHGADHKVADRETVKAWAKQFPDANPGIVMPPGVIGFDVDNHDADGLLALAEFERVNGELPKGPRIFHGYTESGDPSPYGTRLFAWPPEVLDRFGPRMVVGNLAKVTGLPGVDVIAPWLRYNVAPGAIHKSGEPYEWASGSEVKPPGAPTPTPNDLPMLTVKQAEALLTRRAQAATDDPSHGVKPKPIVSAKVSTPETRGTELLRLTRELALLPEGESLMIEGQMRGWQRGDGFYVLACALARAAKAAGRDLEVIGRKFVAQATADGRGLDDYDAERQWENALLSVEDEEEGRADEAYGSAIGQAPRTFVKEYLGRCYTDAASILTLRFADERFWLWEVTPLGSYYRVLTPAEMSSVIARDLDGAKETWVSPDKDSGGFKRDTRIIHMIPKWKAYVLDALRDITLVSRHGDFGELKPAEGGVPFVNGWLNIETGELMPLTPDRDIRWVVPGQYRPDAPEPTEWIKFLTSIGWGPETEEYRLLRQWMGYLLSGNTDQQKAMFLIGPPRGGKGTILKVCEAMLGEGAIGIDLSAFSTNFGLSPVIGKGLAFVDDARFEIKTDKALVRRILSMIAEGTMTVDRKHRDPVSVRCTARVMMCSNEVPAILEASDALASRFLFLEGKESFLGREDRYLLLRLISELPGIVKWSLEGLADLQAQGRFSETTSGKDMQREMGEISNPIRLWVDERCVLEPEAFTTSEELHKKYAAWAESQRMYVLPRQVFGRDLNAAYPNSVLRRGQKRVGSKMERGYYGIRVR